jgi:hypothetical protein
VQRLPHAHEHHVGHAGGVAVLLHHAAGHHQLRARGGGGGGSGEGGARCRAPAAAAKAGPGRPAARTRRPGAGPGCRLAPAPQSARRSGCPAGPCARCSRTGSSLRSRPAGGPGPGQACGVSQRELPGSSSGSSSRDSSRDSSMPAAGLKLRCASCQQPAQADLEPDLFR